MPERSTEIIQHFIGYMHLAELQATDSIHYSGAYSPPPATIEFDAPQPAAAPLRLDLPNPGAPGRPVDLPDVPELGTATKSPGPDWDPSVKPLPPLPFGLAPKKPFFTAPEAGTGTPQQVIQVPPEAPDLKITATYTFGEGQFTVADIDQKSFLDDSDVLTGNAEIITAVGLTNTPLLAADAPAMLAELIAEAEALIPIADLLPGHTADGIQKSEVHNTNDPTAIDTSPEHGGTATSVAANHVYVDGVATPLGPDAVTADLVAAQVADAEAIATLLDERLDTDDEAAAPTTSSGGATADGGSSGIHIENPDKAGAGPAQIVTTGGNVSANAAVISDFGDATASMIIGGDRYETNIIAQINVLSDNDGTAVSADAISAVLPAAGNSIHNEAQFIDEPGKVYGDVSLGGVPGSQTWHIDFAEGDFYDVTTIEQTNGLVDNDFVQQTETEARYVASTGDNGQVNILQIAELGKTYDLIIIAGDYHELNAILQINILLDDDLVTQVSAGFADDAEAGADTDGNTLSNDAMIASIGGASWKPLDGAPADLMEAIGNGETEFDYLLSLGLPGDGDEVFEVLYVTGDYFNYNIIVQTNVISDADEIQQVAIAGSGAAAGDDPFQQQVTAGGNAAENVALIVNQDSTSDYQFLGGEVYEETLLVQANIIADDDDSTIYADLHPDVIAAVAAMSAAEGGIEHQEGASQPAPAALHDPGTDMLGSVMS